MKLATRYQRTNLFASLIIFVLTGIAFYALLQQILYKQVDEGLKIEQRLIQNFIHKHGYLPEDNVSVEDKIVNFKEIETHAKESKFETLFLYDSLDKKRDEFRRITFPVKASGRWYEASIATSLEGADGLGRSIILIALFTVALLLLLSFLSNRLILRRLWRPFYNTLDNLKAFKLGEGKKVRSEVTNIDEFMQLNNTLQQVTDRAEKEYQVLKEFTENASHELQTPLAIIRSKLDLLIQHENLTDSQGYIIHEAYEAIQRMAHLNQSLLLLAKIDNGQFKDTERISLQQLLNNKIQALDSIIQDRNLTLSKELQVAEVNMHPILADVLLNNLLSNAIHHCKPDGWIDVILNANSLTVANSASQRALDENDLYKRFHKVSGDATRTGLGLSIVKNVCDVSGFTVRYQYLDGRHCFIIRWS